MKINSHFFKTASCLIFFLFFLFSCASFLGSRFYSGESLPKMDVAFFYITGNCQLGSVTKEGQKKMEFLTWSEINGEILPGNYILELRYYSSGTYSSSKGESINLPLHAEAGHVYYIEAVRPLPDTWEPYVIDIADDEDYAKILNKNPKNVKEKIEKYFQGERKPLQESEFHTRGGGVIKRWH